MGPVWYLSCHFVLKTISSLVAKHMHPVLRWRRTKYKSSSTFVSYQFDSIYVPVLYRVLFFATVLRKAKNLKSSKTYRTSDISHFLYLMKNITSHLFFSWTICFSALLKTGAVLKPTLSLQPLCGAESRSSLCNFNEAREAEDKSEVPNWPVLHLFQMHTLITVR